MLRVGQGANYPSPEFGRDKTPLLGGGVQPLFLGVFSAGPFGLPSVCHGRRAARQAVNARHGETHGFRLGLRWVTPGFGNGASTVVHGSWNQVARGWALAGFVACALGWVA